MEISRGLVAVASMTTARVNFRHVEECACSSCLNCSKFVNLTVVDTQIELQDFAAHRNPGYCIFIDLLNFAIYILGNYVLLTYTNFMSMHKLHFHCKIVL